MLNLCSGFFTRMIKNIGWKSLQGRRAISRLTLMYEVVHGLTDANFMHRSHIHEF